MIIELHPKFDKAFKKRIQPNHNLKLRFYQRLSLFQKNPKNPLLRDHPLKGSKNQYRSFSISGDIRVVYKPISKNKVLFLDIGTHNQVY